MQLKNRVAGVLAISATAVAMMGAQAFASPVHHHPGGYPERVNAPISLNICGNAIAILGFAEAGCQGGAGVFFVTHESGW